MDFNGSTIFITGIGGFIGRRLAERALVVGANVHGLDISDAAARAREAGAEVHVGGVNDDRAGLARAMQGADVVIHTAAIVREGGDLDEFREVNVVGLRNVANAARDAGVDRFVHLSSVMVHGFEYPPEVDEEGPRRGENSLYCMTKIEGEDALADLHAPDEFEITIIRPGDVYGPGSGPWVERPVSMMRRGMFIVPSTGGVLNPVYVDNLVDGIFLAIATDATGETFTITDGHAIEIPDYFTRLAEAAGLRRPRSVPVWLMHAAVRTQTLALALLRKPAETSSDAINFLRRPHRYSIDKARSRLGYEPKVDFETGMANVAESLRP